MATTSALITVELDGDNLSSAIGSGIPMAGEPSPNTVTVRANRVFSLPILKGSTLMLALNSLASTMVATAELWVRDTDGALWLKVATFSNAVHDTTTPSQAGMYLEQLAGAALVRITSMSIVAPAGSQARLFRL